jgi:hypothetical protein
LSAKDWDQVFREHPEFFRTYEKEEAESDEAPIDLTSFSLVLRRSQRKLWHIKAARLFTVDEKVTLIQDNEVNKKLFTWQPLSADRVTALIDVAVKLHSAQWADREKGRWLYLVGFSFVGSLVGTLFTHFLNK